MKKIINRENETKMKKINLILMIFAVLVMSATSAFAIPQHAHVRHGNVSIATSGSTMTITTASNRAVVNFSSFNIAQNETVKL